MKRKRMALTVLLVSMVLAALITSSGCFFGHWGWDGHHGGGGHDGGGRRGER